MSSMTPKPHTEHNNEVRLPTASKGTNMDEATTSNLSPCKSNKKPSYKHPVTPRATFILIIIAIILLAANMRAPFVALGSIAHVVQEALHISEWHIGWLGSVPMLMFALGAFVSPSIGKRFGLENTMVMALLVLTVGTIVRVVWVGWYAFLLGTLLLSFAIAFINTLAAPIIKQRLPDHIALATGLLSLTMSFMAGIAAGTVYPLTERLGWQWALGGWAFLSTLALIVWIVLRVILGSSHRIPVAMDTNPIVGSEINIWRAPLAWQMAVFMGLQSLLFYTIASFLPSIWISKGLTQVQGGNMGSVFQFMAPLAIISMTYLIRRGVAIQRVAVIASLLNVLGAIGIVFFTAKLAWLWSALLGVGCAGIFTLCMMLFSLRTYTPHQASKLSGMVQTVAYLIAFTGPFGAGWLHEVSQGWQTPLWILLMLMIVNVGFGWLSSRPIMIDGRAI